MNRLQCNRFWPCRRYGAAVAAAAEADPAEVAKAITERLGAKAAAEAAGGAAGAAAAAAVAGAGGAAAAGAVAPAALGSGAQRASLKWEGRDPPCVALRAGPVL